MGCGLLISVPFLPMHIPPAVADPVMEVYGVSEPAGGWAYFKFPDAEQGFTMKYLPTRSAKSRAQFVGMVTTPADGVWGGSESPEEDTVYVFMTAVRATQPLTIPLVWSGDGGLAVFVNGVLIGGEDPGVEVAFDLSVGPEAPVLLELAAHPTPGPWAFGLMRSDTRLPLTSTPGVTIDACTADVAREVCEEASADEVDQPSGSDMPPAITSLTANPSAVIVGGQSTIHLEVVASDEDRLTFTWSASCGTITSSTGAEPKVWTAPATPDTCAVSVTVTDATGASDAASIDLAVTANAAPGGRRGFLPHRSDSPHLTDRLPESFIPRQAPGVPDGTEDYPRASVACSMTQKTTTLSAAMVGQDLAEAVSIVLYQNPNYYAGVPRVFVSTDSGWLVEFDTELNYIRKLNLNAPGGAHQITANSTYLYVHIRDNKHEVLKIKPKPGSDGSTLRIVDRTGSLTGTDSPEGFVFLGGKLYAAIGGPAQTGKIVKIDQTTMTPLGSWPLPASDGITNIENHGFASNGTNLFVLALPKRDVIKARLYKVSQSLSTIGSSLQLPGPSSGLKGGRGGNLYACFGGTCSIYTAPDKLYRINPSNLTIRNSSTYANRSHWFASDANWIYRLGPDDSATGYDLIEAVHPTTLNIVYRINTGAPVLHHGIVQGGYLWVTHETSPRGIIGRYTLYPGPSLCGDQVP
jgi:hypothetical protein